MLVVMVTDKLNFGKRGARHSLSLSISISFSRTFCILVVITVVTFSPLTTSSSYSSLDLVTALIIVLVKGLANSFSLIVFCDRSRLSASGGALFLSNHVFYFYFF